jgi:alpha-mannosidase
MTLTIKQRRQRIERRLPELRFWIDRAFIDLTGWRVNGEPISPGRPWPTREGVVQFDHPEIEVPGDWPVEDVVLDLDLGGEGLLNVRYADDRTEGWGLDPWHRRIPVLSGAFRLEASAVARAPFGVPRRDAHLDRSRLVLVDRAVERLERSLRLVALAIESMENEELALPLIEAAERALADLDWPSATGEYVARSASGQELQNIWALPPDLSSHPAGLTDEQRSAAVAVVTCLEDALRDLQGRYPRRGDIALTGHGHLDLAWLWPMTETRRKAQRTFNTVLSLMDRYPELRFNQSSAQLYAFIEEDDPALFVRIREKVASGQWEPVGGMWVEPDINMPCGESLVRQVLYGQRYFERTFGSTHTVCWLPDCFGFSPALPQILRGAGLDNFFTIKLTWSETNIFPFDLFWWEGLDGSRVLAHMFDNPGVPNSELGGYNADTDPATLVLTWHNFRGKHRFGETLLSFGYGDGGGGVTTEMLEQVRAEEPFPAIPRTQYTSVREFYERLGEGVADETLPVWAGEMYLELHRGTLTTQGRTKYLHRRAERSLMAAEVAASLHHLAGGPEPDSLAPLWHRVLRNEFHDILPGSSIHEVYETTNRELTEVIEAARSIARERLAGLAASAEFPSGEGEALLILNPECSPRPVRVVLDAPAPGAQMVEGGAVVTDSAMAPGLGLTIVAPAEPHQPVEAEADRLENRLLRVTLATDGTLLSVYDKLAGREALAGPGNALWAYVDKPRAWDAWDVDAGYPMAGEPLTVESMAVVERGPHRAAIRLVWRLRDSTVTQHVRLWANSPRLDFHTEIEWHDRRWLLKARFPLGIRSPYATFETAFGVIQRPTHRNTSWDAARFEVAGHRFADLSEPGYGVALLNDGKYGHHALGNELGITLLRSPIYPDPLADEGRQVFTYSLLPHAGDWLQGGVLREAEDLNNPLLAHPVRSDHRGPLPSLLGLTGLPVGLGALKTLEDGGGLVLRVYEPQGARGRAELRLPEGWQADEIDLLERPLGQAQYELTPFQIRSWRLSRG